MGPESSSAFIIPPPPEGSVTPKPEVLDPDPIVAPDFVREGLVAPEQSVLGQDAAAAEAAQRIISSVPGYENQSVDQTPSREGVEVPMPADPSHVIGWDGDVRRG